MFLSFVKVAFRNLVRNRTYAGINLLGLSVGMATAIVIGLWIWDEISYDKSIVDNDRAVQVMHHWNNSAYGTISTERVMPLPAAAELRSKYGDLFEYIALSIPAGKHIFEYKDQVISFDGSFAEPEYTEIFSPRIILGEKNGLADASSIMISKKMADVMFGKENPIGKTLKLDSKDLFTIKGVYENFHANTSFNDLDFILPWDYIAKKSWIKGCSDNWNMNSFLIFAKLNKSEDTQLASNKISGLLKGKPDRNDQPKVFLQPLSRWHLYGEFKNGKNTGGNIRYVKLFTTVGIFVLLLACINFMNLSTARSLKRAKEVGIRKTVGSSFRQLSWLFLSESILIAFISIIIALGLVTLGLPWFNEVTAKEMRLPITDVKFWLSLVAFFLVTGIISGSYPAMFLSSFNPIPALKGTLRIGKLATLPRKLLVVVQFTVSTILIIGTVIVFKQIQHSQNRPLGYDQNGLISVGMTTPDFHGKYNVLRNALISSGAALNMAEASNSPTAINAHLSGFDWKGKAPDLDPTFSVSSITHDFGKTVGWQFTQGRDFSRDFPTDSTGIILNEAAVNFMGLENPLNQTIKFNRKSFRVIGIIKNMIMESPYDMERPTVYLMSYEDVNTITIKVNPEKPMHEALQEISLIFKEFIPSAPFEYSFVNQEYAKKFALEQRVGKISIFFAFFAIFISCLGIFGLSSFITEQRVKEIGVRKVLGASLANLWVLLSKDFLRLVLIALLIASPISWYLMKNWLTNYVYRTTMSFELYVWIGISMLILTIAVISLKIIKAAIANPIKAIKTE